MDWLKPTDIVLSDDLACIGLLIRCVDTPRKSGQGFLKVDGWQRSIEILYALRAWVEVVQVEPNLADITNMLRVVLCVGSGLTLRSASQQNPPSLDVLGSNEQFGDE